MEVVHSYFSRCLSLFLLGSKILTLQKYKRFLICQDFFLKSCGEKGIRTLGTQKRSTVFETAPFDHSGISPQPFIIEKQPFWVALSGDRGIRTPDTFLYNGFQDRRDRPLCHISAAKIQKFSMRQHFFLKFFKIYEIFLTFVPDYEVFLSTYCLYLIANHDVMHRVLQQEVHPIRDFGL